MLKKIIVSIFLITVCSTAVFSQSVTLDHVDGLTPAGNLATNTPITFYIRLTAGEASYVGINNAFEISSPDAVWDTTIGDTVYPMKHLYDGIFVIRYFSTNGVGADTIGFGGSNFLDYGITPGFDEITYAITIGPLSETEIGKTITLDSSFFPPTGVWQWSGNSTDIPSWDGPHTFVIQQGNGDYDYNGEVDIEDLLSMVFYFFDLGEPPVIPALIDLNGDGDIDIVDLIKLVYAIFI